MTERSRREFVLWPLAEAVARVVADGEVTGAEIDDLVGVARTWALTVGDVAEVHRIVPTTLRAVRSRLPRGEEVASA